MHWHKICSGKHLPSICLPGNKVKKTQELVQWLGIWFDPSLSFKEYIKIKSAEITASFHRICRLANTGKGLTPMSSRQIYMAYIVAKADYGMEISWRKQDFISKALQ